MRFYNSQIIFLKSYFFVNPIGEANKFINKISLKYDFRNFNFLKQADFLLYLSVNTYTSTFPLCIPNINLISQIHPHHFNIHKLSIDKINRNVLKLFIEKHVNINIIELKIISIIYNYIYVYI